MTEGESGRTDVQRLAHLARGEDARAARRRARAVDGELISPGSTSLHESLDYWGWQTCTEFGFYQTYTTAQRPSPPAPRTTVHRASHPAPRVSHRASRSSPR